MKSFFAEDEYTIDAKNCIDEVLYIQSMHPKLGLFMTYISEKKYINLINLDNHISE